MRTPSGFSCLIIIILAFSPHIHGIPTLFTTTPIPQPSSYFHETIIVHTNGQESDHFGRCIVANRQIIYVGSDRADGNGFLVNDTTWLEAEQQRDNVTQQQEPRISTKPAWISVVLTPTILVVTENDTHGTAGTRVAWADLDTPLDLHQVLNSKTHRYLGYSLAVDGNKTMVIGDPDFGRGDTGVWVFENAGYQWANKQVLSMGTEDMFGCSVAISMHGTYIFAGAASANADDVVGAGAVYVFAKNNTSYYYLNQTLVAPYLKSASNFGWSMATSNNWIIIGAPASNTVYAFRRDEQQGMFVHWQSIARDKGTLFGYSLSITPEMLVVGSPHNDHIAGAVYLYQQVCLEWQHVAKLVASDASPGDHFGNAVFSVGNIIAVGAPMKNSVGPESGSAYYYHFNQTEIAIPCTSTESPSPSLAGETPTVNPSTTSGVSPSPIPAGKDDMVPIAPLIGGVLGGVALIVVATAITLFIMRRRHPVRLNPLSDGDVMRADRGQALPADEMIIEDEAEAQAVAEAVAATESVPSHTSNRYGGGIWEPSAADASVTRDDLSGAGGFR